MPAKHGEKFVLTLDGIPNVIIDGEIGVRKWLQDNYLDNIQKFSEFEVASKSRVDFIKGEFRIEYSHFGEHHIVEAHFVPYHPDGLFSKEKYHGRCK